MNRPNLFDYATSELSQDAVICYLLEFYNYENEYKEEHELAQVFIKIILKEIGLNIECSHIKVRKQYKNIDVLLIINEEYYIIIEDKTNTKQHQEQILKYMKRLEKEEKVEKQKIYGLYFKTGDESLTSLESMKNSKKVEYNKYGIMMRESIIKFLDSYNGKNLIINDYKKYLKEKEKKQKKYRKKNEDGEYFYDWDGIIGFYKKLDLEFLRLKKENSLPRNKNEDVLGFNWGYTPNQNGGFMCYWFNNILSFDGKEYYLQIEKINVAKNLFKEKIGCKWTNNVVKYPEITLVVKVKSENKKTDILYEGLKIFEDKYKENFEKRLLLRPNRFAPGNWMTQLLINDYIVLENNSINISKTVERILSYVQMLNELENDFKNINVD